jgi:hypothetical protein
MVTVEANRVKIVDSWHFAYSRKSHVFVRIASFGSAEEVIAVGQVGRERASCAIRNVGRKLNGAQEYSSDLILL